MKIKKLNFEAKEMFDLPEVLLFGRPLGSKLHRCNRVPEGLTLEKEKEVRQVLNTLCVRFKNGCWFFRVGGKEDREDFTTMFWQMDVPTFVVSFETDPQHSN